MYDEVLELIRKIAPEFDDINDNELTGFISIYADLVSKKYFGKHYNKAVAFLSLISSHCSILQTTAKQAQRIAH